MRWKSSKEFPLTYLAVEIFIRFDVAQTCSLIQHRIFFYHINFYLLSSDASRISFKLQLVLLLKKCFVANFLKSSLNSPFSECVYIALFKGLQSPNEKPFMLLPRLITKVALGHRSVITL